jgi:hypothetical protein
MEENIFKADQAEQPKQEAPTAPAPAAPAFSIPTEVETLVGDGKKYKSVDDALKALPHAQTHIQKLEEENRKIREELQKRQTAEELLNEMRQVSAPQQTTPGVEADPEVLSHIVEQVMQKRELQNVAKQNANSVVSKFTELYGEKAESMYNSLAGKTGLSVQDLHNLAQRSPQAVFKLAGIDSVKQNNNTKLYGDVNTLNVATPKEPGSSRVPNHATSKDMAASLAAARQAVMTKYS